MEKATYGKIAANVLAAVENALKETGCLLHHFEMTVYGQITIRAHSQAAADIHKSFSAENAQGKEI
jgi:hypothetical protein